VFGYNYSFENVQGAGETNLNQGWTPCDISMHGHFPNNNLFEGNMVQEIDIADYWGPCGRGNTVFRCNVLAEGIDIFDQSHDQNIAANVIPTAAYGISIEAGVLRTLLHGNVLNGTVQWDQSVSDHGFSASLYLTSKPAWWCGNIPWPAIGPDVTGLTNDIPAKLRYESRLCESNAVRTPMKPAPENRAAIIAVYNLSGRMVRKSFGDDGGRRMIRETPGPCAAYVALIRYKDGVVPKRFMLVK
jgi:hypothetical protein